MIQCLGASWIFESLVPHSWASRSVIAAGQTGLDLAESVYGYAPERRSPPNPPRRPFAARKPSSSRPPARPSAHGVRCGPSPSPPCPAIPPRRKGPPHCMPASGAWRSASGSGRPVARGPCVTCPPPALPAPPVNFAVPQIRRANSAGYIVDATSKHDGFCNVRTETTAMRALFLGRPWMRDCPSTPNPWQSCGSCQ